MSLLDFLGSGSGSFNGLSSMVDGANQGGSRTFIDVLKMGNNRNIGDIVKELMTNAPAGVSQVTKGPWMFNG